MISIKEKQITKDNRVSQILDLPLTQFKINLYNYTAINLVGEFKIVKADRENRDDENSVLAQMAKGSKNHQDDQIKWFADREG